MLRTKSNLRPVPMSSWPESSTTELCETTKNTVIKDWRVLTNVKFWFCSYSHQIMSKKIGMVARRSSDSVTRKKQQNKNNMINSQQSLSIKISWKQRRLWDNLWGNRQWAIDCLLTQGQEGLNPTGFLMPMGYRPRRERVRPRTSNWQFDNKDT